VKNLKKKLLNFKKKHKFLEDKFYKTIELLEKDPFYPFLGLHNIGNHDEVY